MKKYILYILFGAAMLAAFTACEPKFEYNRTAYVIMDETSVTVSEDMSSINPDTLLVLTVTAYPLNGATVNTEVQFEVKDGEGDNGAKVLDGDYSIVSPVNGLLVFDGNNTATISFRISNANVGIYTGRKNFSVELTNATNGYDLGGAYYTTVYISDTDKNLEGNPITGTYAASGPAYSGGYTAETSWELHIYENPDNPDLYYVDGLVPGYTGGYETYGDFRYAAYGWLEDDDQKLVIPSQVSDTQVNSSSGTYYIGFTPVTQYSDGGWYYSSQYPDLVFTYDSSSDQWVSDYGVFFAGFTSKDLSSMAVFFDAVAPSITIVRVDD